MKNPRYQGGGSSHVNSFKVTSVWDALTEKESAVLLHILQAKNTKAMAESMGISAKGIEFHISNILHKTGIKKRRDVLRAFAQWTMHKN